jgi:uncharacterized coiled-coil protein SlyX
MTPQPDDEETVDEFADAVVAFHEEGDLSASALDRLKERIAQIEEAALSRVRSTP